MGLKSICRSLSRFSLLLPSAFLGQVLQAQDLSELMSLADMNPEAACLVLEGRNIPASAIGLETAGARIEDSSYLQTDNVAGLMFCKVTGQILSVSPNAPAITFQVNLPSNWNGKSLQYGGGGLNGVLITGLDHYNRQPESEATPLARGYVTLGSDSGHQSSGGFNADFMLFEEALRNFGHEQIKKTHDVAMLLIQARYGSASRYNYFIGGSQGGHEAFDAVQRYPQDYDGAVAAYPAYNLVMLHLSANQYAKALHANDGASWINPEKARNFVSRIYESCDVLDNLQDGIISNINACESATEIFKTYDASNPIRCVGGQDTGNTCLSDAQLEALNVLDTPFDLGFSIYADDEGNSIFPRWSPFIGSTFFDGNFPNLGAQGPGDSLQFRPGSATPGYAIAQNLNMDPMTEFNPAEYAGRITALTGMMSATSVNLDTFHARGGKLIFYHGLADDFIPFYSSIQYWDRLQTRYERSTLDEFVRFYTIPGMGHQTGPFSARLSTLDALEAWVERDQAPGELRAIDNNQSSFGRSRPVCIYPQWPRYNGTDDINLAESFTCVD
jgi:pimeloyl-ACP methyl ester carboxylesterase